MDFYAKIFLILYPPFENSTTCTAIVSSSLKVEYPPGLKGEKAAPHYDLNRAGRSIEQKAEKI